MKMRRRILLCGIAVGVLTGLAGWLWPRPPAHLLLITLDTTRADRLGCYGYAAGRTPVLDALAKTGVLCERAYTVAPVTLPAHTSLFTGLYPAETGVRTNGRGRLDDGLTTLAEVLRRQGYETAAFVASFVLDRKFGLDRGFDIYDDDLVVGELVGDDPDGHAVHRQRSGVAVVDAALKWLGKPRSRPFFCWVHLYDPHFPYLAHSDLFKDEFVERPYDAEIAYVDRQVGRLVDFLKARRLDEQTLVVVVGDHGEALGEHLERTHGFTLYDATMRVPLIFRHPAQLNSGGRVATNVSLVDVSPTILEHLGLPEPRQISGKSFQRELLRNAVTPVGLVKTRPTLHGSTGIAGPTSPASPCYGATDDPLLINGWSPLRSLTEGDWKYIRTTKVELYNLANDPEELHNLAEADPGQARIMESRLADLESRLVPRDESQVQLSAADRRALASLGYAGGTRAAREGPVPANLPDVKDMLPFNNAVYDANELIHKGSIEAGIERLQETIRQAPIHKMAYLALGDALRNQAKYDEAAQVFRSLLDLCPDASEGHYGLGNVLVAQGQIEEAIAEFAKALESDSDFAEAHVNLGIALVETGRPAEALAHFNAVIQINPRDTAAFQWRALVRIRLGQFDEAIADYRQALEYVPDSSEAHHNLGIVLADHGEADEARRHLTRAVQIEPQSAELQFDLGAFLVRRRRYQEALVPLNQALRLKPGHVAAGKALQAARQALAGRKPGPE